MASTPQVLAKIRALKLQGLAEFAASLNTKEAELPSGVLVDVERKIVYYSEHAGADQAWDAICDAYVGSDVTLRTRWLDKLALASQEDVQAVQVAMRSGAKTWTEVVDALNNPVQRLVAIHIVNALAQSTAPCDRAGIDITRWGSTADLCTRKRWYSLTPLWSYYCIPELQSGYGRALRVLVNESSAVLASNPDVLAAAKNLLEEIGHGR